MKGDGLDGKGKESVEDFLMTELRRERIVGVDDIRKEREEEVDGVEDEVKGKEKS